MLESCTVKIAVPREVAAGERRVALVPETVARLVKSRLGIAVETRAGEASVFPDAAYAEAGATVAADPETLLADADVVLKVQKPTTHPTLHRHEVELLRPGSALISFLQPVTGAEVVQRLAARGVTSFSLDFLPRITRAQSMDALSSQSTVAGYKAVLMAAARLGKFFPMLITAAGTVVPAKVLVLGAGVAGLQAIATARRLGAVVEGYDVRAAVREEVRSLGATFVELPLEQQDAQDKGGYAREQSEEFNRRQQELLSQHVRAADVVITTAMIPGKPAPVLVTEAMVLGMRPGSVIIDLAAESGGNCVLTRPGEEVVRNGVVINGALNVASTMPIHASQLYSKNIASFLTYLLGDGALQVDLEDEITRSTCITHQGQIVHPAAQALVRAAG